MRTLCAWCGGTISVTCTHCNVPLTHSTYAGTYLDSGAMICLNGQSPIIYSPRAIETMETSHGMCPYCAALPPQTRDAQLAKRRAYDKQIPNDQALQNTIAEKRGPTQVPAAPTDTRKPTDKKAGKP
jgi:hypothetical protein